MLFQQALCILAAGFVYGVVYAGIPYQDPTPAMEPRYNFHASIASRIEIAGLLVLAVGVLWFIGSWIYLVRQKK